MEKAPDVSVSWIRSSMSISSVIGSRLNAGAPPDESLGHWPNIAHRSFMSKNR